MPRAGSGRLLFVAGEAGIGKTRLLGVIAWQAQARGFAVACIRAAHARAAGPATFAYVSSTNHQLPGTWQHGWAASINSAANRCTRWQTLT
jgi:hypothetical protein